MSSLLATNLNETFEFLSLIPAKYYLKAWATPLVAILLFVLARLFGIKPWLNKTYVLSSIALMAIALEPTQIVKQTFLAGKVTREKIEELKKYSAENSWGKSTTLSKNTDYVLIIGESARKDYFHNYGYPVKDTPFLDRVNAITVDGLKAGGTYTIASVTNMLTSGNLHSWSPRYNYSLIDLANSAGIKTYWISNQGYVGKFDTPVTAIANKANKTVFTTKSSFEKQNLSDFLLLKDFKKIIEDNSDSSRLIVLHTLGSHPDACRRVVDFKKAFKVKDKGLKYVACYVSSIKKTDAFIEKVYELLKKEKEKTGRPFSIIYFSDHGQVHEVKNGTVKLHNNATSKFHYDIPLIRIDSDYTDRKFFTSQKSGLRFTEGLANWMKIRNPQLESYDLFDGKNDPKDFGLKDRIDAIKTPPDPAVDISSYLDRD